MHTYQRPATLYRYSEQHLLERALKLGQFRLRPAAPCLTLSFSTVWDLALFDTFGPADACLVIHHTEEFGERLHRAVQKILPSWAGIDGAVEYGSKSPLGIVFTKTASDAIEQEWLFAWRALQSNLARKPIIVSIGNIESFAELKTKDAHVS